MSSPSPHTGRLPGGAISWLSIIGLGVVLVAFAALIVGGSVNDTHTAKHAEHSGDLAEAYLTAQDALSREDEVEDVYKDAPNPDLHGQFEMAAGDFDTAMASLQEHGDLRDTALARRASALHRRYSIAMRDIFKAGDDEKLVEQIHDERTDPAQDALQPLINGTGRQYAVAQLKALDALQRGERRELVAASVAVPLGAILYILLVTVFIRQRRRLDAVTRAEVARLDEAAHTDSLTGLLNRRALQRDLADRDSTPQVMAMLDVVGLKPVNDHQGHLAGDALLQGVAAALREEVAGTGRAYRIGGDEFAVILPGADEAGGHAAVDAIRDRVAVRHPAGIRGGIACGTDPATLAEHASRALLEARSYSSVA